MKSIASKFNILSIFLVMFTAVITSSYIIWQHRSSAIDSFKVQGKEIVSMLSKNLVYGVYTENQEAIAHSLQSIEDNPDIAYVLVYDDRGTIITEKNWHHLSRLPTQYAKVLSNTSTFTNDFISANGQKYFNIIAPVSIRPGYTGTNFDGDFTTPKPLSGNSETIGYVQIGISQANINKQAKQFLLQALMIAPGSILFSIGLTLWQTRRITKPVKQLVSASQAIAKGDFGKKVTIDSSTDEIAELGQSFNKMSEELSEYQDKVLKHRDILEEEVLQRTVDLQKKTDEALELAQKAKAASKAKSEFLATMSHEIRTPMNGVLGMTELLLNSGLTKRQQQLAETAFRSAKSLLGVINNILDFSKIESGKLTLSVKEFELRHMLNETIEMMSLQVANDIELILNLPCDFNGLIRTDEEKLRQVIVNLLGNALKFTEQGQIELKVSELTNENVGQEKCLLFEIIDSGCGIPAEKLAHIFDSFTQVDNSASRTYGGTGLGLAISKQLVALLGGDLLVNSRQYLGSTFYFKLNVPFIPAEQSALDLTAIQNLSILLVDDNQTIRSIGERQLRAWGVNCLSVDSGEKALKVLIESARIHQPYSCIIIDQKMPGMDGLALALEIRDEPRIPGIHIILAGSAKSPLDTSEYSKYGINHFLTKPISDKNLHYSLLKIFDSQHSTIEKQHDFINGTCIRKLHGSVLLAEDNLINQEVAKSILNLVGCDVKLALDGFEVIKQIEKNTFDLILMDCHMPGMDGFEATVKIRQREKELQLNKVPIIALTADVQQNVIQQCTDFGMDGYLSKPYTRKQLIDVLEKWLCQLESSGKNAVKVASHQDSILDAHALDDLRDLTTDDGKNLLEKAVNIFLETAPMELAALDKAINEKNAEVMANIAHNFKSACGNLGAKKLADDVSSLETKGRQGEITGAKQVLTAIRDELPKVFDALRNAIILDNTQHAGNLTARQITKDKAFNRILLIDDDAAFRMLIGNLLRNENFIVDEATGGKEGVKCVEKVVPDLILLDAVMPFLDGFATCKQLRQNPALTDTPIIMVTGMDDIDSINKAFYSGATDFIAKPINNFQILIQRVNFGLRTGQVTAELRNSKIQLSAAQRIARLGYWTWDTQKDRFTLSDQLAQLCGVDLTMFDNTLEGFINLIHPQDREFVRDVIYAAAHNHTIRHIEYKIVVSANEVIEVQQEIEAVSSLNLVFITGIVQDISHKKQSELQIHRLAYFDHLTGLANRSYYQGRLEDIIMSSTQRKAQFALMFIDLDGFKIINDSFGHHIGDLYLQEVANRLKLIAREIDFIARLGGDEFCIILGNVTDESIVAEIAKRCLQKLSQPLLLENHQLTPKASIGISLFPKDGSTEAELLLAADTAMYLAKQTGKQRFIFFSPYMANQIQVRQEKERMLREASANDQFILFYQPQVSLVTGEIVGLEALARWQHPDKGIISPNEFIALTEQLGLVSQLGHWTIKTACEQIAEWRRMGLPFIQVGVNISPAYFQDPGMLTSIKELLSINQIPPEYLLLEITENGLQTVGSIEIFNQIRALGVKVVVDDFGSGLSSLSSLKQLPLNGLKIDKIFIEDLLTNPNTPLLLGTIIGLAKALNLTLVAEGVETKDQASILHNLGCSIMQGYLFSHPILGKDIPALILGEQLTQDKFVLLS